MKLFLIIAFLLSGKLNAQPRELEFYGDIFKLPVLSGLDRDSLLNQNVIPTRVREYIDGNIKIAALDDWALVYFLDAFVDALFADEKESNKVKVLNSILTELGINNAIGVITKEKLLSLVSIDNKATPINDAHYFEKDGYRFMAVKKQDKTRSLKDLEMNCRATFIDIQLDYAKTPKIQNVNFESRGAYFFNYCTRAEDSINFSYSALYNKYYNDLPRIIPDRHYYLADVSPVFRATFFNAMDTKLKPCPNRLDSINFLIKFVQTAIVYEEDEKIYGKKDFCSFPENTLALGKGDCEDKAELFAFLIHHYFKGIDIAFLYYPNHVRIGLHDPLLSLVDKPFQEFEGEKYFEAELQGNETILADEVFSIFHSTPLFIIK